MRLTYFVVIQSLRKERRLAAQDKFMESVLLVAVYDGQIRERVAGHVTDSLQSAERFQTGWRNLYLSIPFAMLVAQLEEIVVVSASVIPRPEEAISNVGLIGKRGCVGCKDDGVKLKGVRIDTRISDSRASTIRSDINTRMTLLSVIVGSKKGLPQMRKN